MTCYAVAQLHAVEMSPDLVAYIKAIDDTLAPYQGRFIIHGGEVENLEGVFDRDLVMIVFPNLQAARTWYASPAYQAILPQRLASAQGEVFLIEGVDAQHQATDILSR